MRKILYVLFALCGLSISCFRAPAPAPDPKLESRLAAIEQRLGTLEKNSRATLSFMRADTTNTQDTATALGIFHQRISSLENWRAAFADTPAPALDPATGLPYGADPRDYSGAIDPRTGIPLRDRPRK
jgi:hypothetical protein